MPTSELELRRKEQPISFIKDVEPDLSVYDLVIQQQQIEEMESFDTIDAEELAKDVIQLLGESDPKFRRYLDIKPTYVSKIKYTHDAYPVPMRGYNDALQVLVCFAKSWSKDWGGEIIAYTECEPSDIIASHPGRISVLSNDAWWKVTHPNVAATYDLDYLFFVLPNKNN